MNFWEFFFLLVIFVPLAMVWAFALVDVFRRDDIGGGLKAVWVLVIFFFPFFGTLIYLVFRRPGATAHEREAMSEVAGASSGGSSADQLKVLADLHDAGKLTDEEFATEKAKIIAG